MLKWAIWKDVTNRGVEGIVKKTLRLARFAHHNSGCICYKDARAFKSLKPGRADEFGFPVSRAVF